MLPRQRYKREFALPSDCHFALRMPGKQRSQRRKKGARSARFAPGRTVMPIMPGSRTVQLTFVSRRILTEAAPDTGATYTFSLTNLYDPDKTGVGAQPINFDQLSTLYTFFRVLRVEYDIEFVNLSVNQGTACVVGIVPTWNDALPSSPNSWMGVAFSQNRTLAQGAGHNHTKFTGTMLPWQLLQVPRQVYLTDLDYTCTATGGPARNCYMTLFSLGTAGITSVAATVRITYHVKAMIPVLNSLS
jgi:hypothetical protein